MLSSVPHHAHSLLVVFALLFTALCEILLLVFLNSLISSVCFCCWFYSSVTSSSIWINIPVAVLLLAVVRRLSLEVEIRRKPPDGPPPPRHQLRRQLNPNDPLLSAPSNFARSRRARYYHLKVIDFICI